MQVVIEIPDEVMESREYVNYFEAWSAKLTSVIENAIVLPKGHGRLIDASKLRFEGIAEAERQVYGAGWDFVGKCRDMVYFAPTIVEADE